MKINQIYDIVNTISDEMLGESALVNEDLSNIVDVGRSFANLNSNDYERYVKSLIDHIGRMVFVNRPYNGTLPSLMRDAWEFGSILEKVQAELPDATANQTWNLTDGQVYEQDTFTQPEVSAKIYNSLNTFEIPMSFAERQSKSAFDSVSQLNAFFSMIDTSIYNALTVRTDGEAMRLVLQAIADTLADSFPSGVYDGQTSVKAVNLLALYNQQHSSAQINTLANALTSPDFIRFASFTMSTYEIRMRKISKLFNIGGKARFTPADRLHFILLSDFAKAADVFNQSDTFHDQFTALPNADVVPYWQGSGTNYSLNSISTINVTTATSTGTGGASVNCDGILGVMFDHDALALCNQNQRVTTHYNARAEFYNSWYKVDNQTLWDNNENCVVFFAADSGE